MTTTARRLAIPRTLTLLASTALASSVILASAGATLAAKPVPVAQANSPRCDAYDLGTTSKTSYSVNYNLMDNKGRWLFVHVDLTTEAGQKLTTNRDVPEKFDKGDNLAVEAVTPLPPQPATFELVFTDRKGAFVHSIETPVCG